MSLNNWLGDTGANRYKQTYFNGFVDINNSDLILRNGNIYLGTGSTGGTGAFIINNSISISKNELAALDGATGNLQNLLNNFGATGAAYTTSVHNLQNQLNNFRATGAANTTSEHNLQNQLNNFGATGTANTTSINNLTTQL